MLQLLNDERVDIPFRQHAIPQEFLDHAKRDAILERIGLTAQALARGIVEDVTALDRAREADGDSHPEAQRGDPCRVRRSTTASWTDPDTRRPPAAAAIAAVLVLLLASGRLQRRRPDDHARRWWRAAKVNVADAKPRSSGSSTSAPGPSASATSTLFLRRVDHRTRG